MTIRVHKLKEAEVVETSVGSVEENELVLLQQTFNVSQLDRLKDQYLFLSVNGIDDKDGYKECDSARKLVKRIRTSIQDRYQQIAKGLDDRKKSVKKLADDFIDELKKIELHLAEQQKVIDDQKEKLRVEKLNLRLESLTKYGHLKLSPRVIEAMNQAEFDEYLNQAGLDFEAEQKRIAEEAERKRVEAERLQKDQQDKLNAQAVAAASKVVEKGHEVKPTEVAPVHVLPTEPISQEIPKTFIVKVPVPAYLLQPYAEHAKGMTITVEFESSPAGVVALQLVSNQSNNVGF